MYVWNSHSNFHSLLLLGKFIVSNYKSRESTEWLTTLWSGRVELLLIISACYLLTSQVVVGDWNQNIFTTRANKCCIHSTNCYLFLGWLSTGENVISVKQCQLNSVNINTFLKLTAMFNGIYCSFCILFFLCHQTMFNSCVVVVTICNHCIIIHPWEWGREIRRSRTLTVDAENGSENDLCLQLRWRREGDNPTKNRRSCSCSSQILLPNFSSLLLPQPSFGNGPANKSSMVGWSVLMWFSPHKPPLLPLHTVRTYLVVVKVSEWLSERRNSQ